MTQTIPLDDVKVGDRLRKDLGDIDALATSIATCGLMHPIVIDADNNLIAGGRRFAAYQLLHKTTLEETGSMRFCEVPFTRFESLSQSKRLMLEVEENVRRQEMTWQERCRAVKTYHEAAKREALLGNEKWSQKQTGEILNIEQAHVSVVLKLADELEANPDSDIAKASSSVDALRLLAIRKSDEAAKERLRRVQAQQAKVAAKVDLGSGRPASTKLADLTDKPGSLISSLNLDAPTDSQTLEVSNKVSQPKFSIEQISSMYYHGNSIELLPKLASAMVINHIICDPPYGIDMVNVSNSTRVEATHDVEDNLELFPTFLRVAYDCIAEDGFLAMWYDLDHHEKLIRLASKIGWRVQRWPVVWVKTSVAKNEAAQYNFTKATENCLILRRSEKSVIKKLPAVNYVMTSAVGDITHPFVKPFEVWKHLYDALCVEGQSVCDPFAGQGSSLAAALRCNLSPVGIECDEQHIAHGLTYIQEQLNKVSVPSFLL